MEQGKDPIFINPNCTVRDYPSGCTNRGVPEVRSEMMSSGGEAGVQGLQGF